MNEEIRLKAWRDQLSPDERTLVDMIEGVDTEQALQMVLISARRDVDRLASSHELAMQNLAEKQANDLLAMEQRMRDAITAAQTPLWRALATSGSTFTVGVMTAVVAVIADVQKHIPG